MLTKRLKNFSLKEKNIKTYLSQIKLHSIFSILGRDENLRIGYNK